MPVNGSSSFVLSYKNHENSTALTNSSAAEWSVIPVCFIISSVGGSLTNAAVLLAFVRDHRTLINPFTVHVIHLLLLNLINSLTQYPVGVAASLYTRWQPGPAICDLYLFGNSMFTAGTINIHGLIALNRAWAIVHPLSYRTRNTKRFSLQLCLGLWLFLWIVQFPNWLLNTILFRRPGECTYNSDAMPAYNAFLDVAVFTLPVLLVIASFVVVSVYKFVLARRHHSIRRNQVSVLRKQSQTVQRGNSELDGPPSDVSIVKVTLQTRQRKYMVLALLTASVVIFCLPSTIFFGLVVWIPGFWGHDFYVVSTVLVPVQLMLDPILFTLTLDKLQTAVGRVLRFKFQN
ncbi:hypothetical protein BV898_07900 [Hypsibius exemplaris]|uniref:G-protein coupled receptors family 1 profile domain-containing protein n=1 Tax=Hypsibius exemplaris TaxID=2072580 RepID=A0A1W0WS03_HYPEX|nr:hypothetical protein BV898_07900 [Hypsibius exemplaris]